MFGFDELNLVSIPLQNAMYINFKANITERVSLYQTLKHIKTVKLGELVIGNDKDANGFCNVTLPVFIADEVAKAFDKEFPDINKNPINPFNATSPVSETIFFPISSLIGNLIADGCLVNLNTVSVNKIVLYCGYARKRSNDIYVCLGDSAAYLAFSKSLNLGLKHALDLFVRLSIKYHHVQVQNNVLEQFKVDNPTLNAIRFYPTEGNNVYLVVTKVIYYGCYSYCLTNRKTERLTSSLGVYESQIDEIHKKLNEELSSWSSLLIHFEVMRDREITNEIRSNQGTNMRYDQLSWLIGINGKSFIKISELSRAASGKYSLYTKDFKFLEQCFVVRRDIVRASCGVEAVTTIKVVAALLRCGENVELNKLSELLRGANVSDDQRLINFYREVKSDSWRNRVIHHKAQLFVNVHVKEKFISDIVINELATRTKHCDISITRFCPDDDDEDNITIRTFNITI